MAPQFDAPIYAASIWVIPLIIAITFHEAAHGYVARFFGDNTAWQFGLVRFNATTLFGISRPQRGAVSKVEERAGQSDRYWGDRQRPPSALFGDDDTDYFI